MYKNHSQKKEKQVQIPEKLFKELLKCHVLGIECDSLYIRKELELKMDAMANRQRYTQQLKNMELGSTFERSDSK